MRALPFAFRKAPAGGGGGPTFTPVVSDNFNALSAGSALAGQGNWVSSTGVHFVDFSGDNYIRPVSSSAIEVTRNTTTLTTDQYAEITVENLQAGALLIGVAVRIQSGADTHYRLFFRPDTQTLSLDRQVAGTGVGITTYSSRGYAAGAKIRLGATGAGSATRLQVWEDTGSGWVSVASNVDPVGYIDGGFAGVSGYGDGDLRGDDFVAGNIT